jgi:hypothetical protein
VLRVSSNWSNRKNDSIAVTFLQLHGHNTHSDWGRVWCPCTSQKIFCERKRSTFTRLALQCKEGQKTRRERINKDRNGRRMPLRYHLTYDKYWWDWHVDIENKKNKKWSGHRHSDKLFRCCQAWVLHGMKPFWGWDIQSIQRVPWRFWCRTEAFYSFVWLRKEIVSPSKSVHSKPFRTELPAL